MVWILAALIVISRVLYPGFLDIQNILNILSQNAAVGIIAVGMTFVMVGGGFDLSVGALYAAGATFYAAQAMSLPLPLAATLTLLVGVLAGLLNGLVITKLRVNPFVATLGSSSIFMGAALLYSRSGPMIVDKPAFRLLGAGRWFGIPISVLLLLAVFAAGWTVLSRTVYGRSLFVLGGNPEAARLAGLRVGLLRLSTYVLVSTLAVVGGMLIASRVGMGQANIGGTVALDAISMVIIGGTSLFGGAGSVWRTAIGLLVLATLTNLFDSLALDANLQLIVKGAVVISAVALDAFTQSRR
ncbi:ribose ABC transporter permease [Inquilinus limosus]|uniref:Autoinducer 2 import system permease protein LsrD n=2 Tax=Inquilinus limosus TaxID=171674 RepID=A0A211ZES1_9PROT|nr:ribose ABC transporter permease [Inquilinus limosus]